MNYDLLLKNGTAVTIAGQIHTDIYEHSLLYLRMARRRQRRHIIVLVEGGWRGRQGGTRCAGLRLHRIPHPFHNNHRLRGECPLSWWQSRVLREKWCGLETAVMASRWSCMRPENRGLGLCLGLEESVSITSLIESVRERAMHALPAVFSPDALISDWSIGPF